MKSQAILLITLCLLTLSLTPALSSETSNEIFLKNCEAEKTWWFMGAFSTLGLQVAQTDKTKADCIWNWYATNRLHKNKELEAAMRKYPKHAPSTIVMGILQRDCGKF